MILDQSPLEYYNINYYSLIFYKKFFSTNSDIADFFLNLLKYSYATVNCCQNWCLITILNGKKIQK